MEKNHNSLQNAIRRFPVFEPGDEVWHAIQEELQSQPLRQALTEMPAYEPDDQLWNLIEKRLSGTDGRNGGTPPQVFCWRLE